MTAVAIPITLAGMSKPSEDAKSGSDKEPVNMRLSGRLLDRARDFISKQPVRPTMTAVVEAALLEWLDKHHPPGKPKPK